MLKNSCRICLTGDSSLLLNLFPLELTSDGYSYADQLVFLAGVEVSKEDELPKKICRECVEQVSLACVIKRRCIETDQILRQKVKCFVEQLDDCSEPEYFPNPMEDNFSDQGDHFDDQESVEEETDDHQSFKIIVKDQPDWFVILDSEPFPLFDDPVSSDEELKPEKTPRSSHQDLLCVFCDEVFAKVHQKKKHLKEAHANEVVCRTCKKKHQTVIGNEECTKAHLFGPKYLCQICAKPFNRKKTFDAHVLGVHGGEENPENVFRCDLCGASFRYKPNLSRHFKTRHFQQKITCNFDNCNEKYTTKYALNFHLFNFHKVPAPVKCPLCGNGYSSASELKAHLKSTSRCKDKTLQTAFRTKKLKMIEHCTVVNGKFKCNFCPKIYESKVKFGCHFHSCHKDNRTCKICEKTFGITHNLRRHMKSVHMGLRNYVCDYAGCGKSFSAKKGLINHINSIHTGEKPYACNIDDCNFRSGDSAALSKHKKNNH